MGRGFQVVDNRFREHKKVVADPFNGGAVTVYANINLPTRATSRSAGYDFYMPCDTMLLPGKKTIIWSDVKAYMEEDEVLELHIRSSIGIKQGVILSNITGIIDSDYFENEGNDGNIGLALLNTSGVGVELKAGTKVAQGIFKKYLLADNDQPVSEERVGGVGSTDK